MLLERKAKIVLFVSFIALILTVLHRSSNTTEPITNPMIALYNTSAKYLLSEELELISTSNKDPTDSASGGKVNRQQWLRKHPPPSLSQAAVDGVEKFVLFVGYPRSGHSIIGSMMDSHQNMIISHEYMIFREWAENPKKFTNRTYLFNELYQASYVNAQIGLRSASHNEKGYTLAMDSNSTWQGTFKQLKVIGDKSGGMTVLMYLQDPKEFAQHFQELRAMIKVPIHVLHIVRNPYDIIATSALYRDSHSPGKLNASKEHKYSNPDALRPKTHFLFKLAQAVEEMTKKFRLNILQLYSEDFIRGPKDSLQRICRFLELDCPEDYLQHCSEKMYKSVSRTRDKVVWPQQILDMVDSNKKRFAFFKDYTFEDDFPR